MAKNGARGGGRSGSVRRRTQFQHPNGNWIKRDRSTGRFVKHKDSGPFKGVAQEPDGRKD